jgi:hypothetical protein
MKITLSSDDRAALAHNNAELGPDFMEYFEDYLDQDWSITDSLEEIIEEAKESFIKDNPNLLTAETFITTLIWAIENHTASVGGIYTALVRFRNKDLFPNWMDEV